MFDAIYNWLLTILQFVLDTFETVLEATGTTSFYISGFFIFFAISAFFLPMLHKGISIGSGVSDAARNSSGYYKSSKGGYYSKSYWYRRSHGGNRSSSSSGGQKKSK